MHRLSLDVKITNNVLAKLRIYSTNIGPANANIRRDLQITNANANISKFYGFVFVPTPTQTRETLTNGMPSLHSDSIQIS